MLDEIFCLVFREGRERYRICVGENDLSDISFRELLTNVRFHADDIEHFPLIDAPVYFASAEFDINAIDTFKHIEDLKAPCGLQNCTVLDIYSCQDARVVKKIARLCDTDSVRVK